MATYTGKQLLYPDVTEVDIATARKGAFEYQILQQFGFAVDATSNRLDKNFYKLNADFTAVPMVVDASQDASANLIFDALSSQTTLGYLVDQDEGAGDDVIDISGWSESGLSGTSSGNESIGQQIVKGVINPMFNLGRWGTANLDSGNVTSIAPTVPTMSDTTSLDYLIATGLATTINNADQDAHEEILGHLLDQVIDTSANDAINSNVSAAQELSIVTSPDVSGNSLTPYAEQYFWMKVYLDVAFGGTSDAVTDYEQSGLEDGPLADDDDDTVNSQANLVAKTAGAQTVAYSDLNSTFLNNFKGQVHHSSGSVVEYGNGSTPNPPSDTSVAVDKVKVPILIKFHVNA